MECHGDSRMLRRDSAPAPQQQTDGTDIFLGRDTLPHPFRRDGPLFSTEAPVWGKQAYKLGDHCYTDSGIVTSEKFSARFECFLPNEGRLPLVQKDNSDVIL